MFTHGHTDNINVKAAYIHVLGDMLQSVGVMIAAALIWWKPTWRFLDPVCTILFAFLVLGTTFGLLKVCPLSPSVSFSLWVCGCVLCGYAHICSLIWWKPTWWFLDPVCTILFAFLVLGTTCGLLKVCSPSLPPPPSPSLFL